MKYFMYSEKTGFQVCDTAEEAKQKMNDFLEPESTTDEEMAGTFRGEITEERDGVFRGKVTGSVIGVTLTTIPEGHNAVVSPIKKLKLVE